MQKNEKYTFEIKNIAEKFYSALKENGMLSEDYLAGLQQKLDRSFYSLLQSPKPKIMVYGIYNSGKSTLVNALCERAVAEVADRPMTYRIGEYDAGKYILIDSPGVDAPLDHEEIADDQLDDCHIILFVISSKGIFESRANYMKMNLLIEKGIPFYIILNDRGAALPGDPSKREQAQQKHNEEINQIKRKIIDNLSKISGDKRIGDKYDVLVLNAKRAWSGVEQKRPALVEKSNISALRSRIDQILMEQGAMKWLQAPITALDTCIGEAESQLYKQLGNDDYADERDVLLLKMAGMRDETARQLQSIIYAHRDEVYNLQFHSPGAGLGQTAEDISREIHEVYKRESMSLIQYIKAEFPDLDICVEDIHINYTPQEAPVMPAGTASISEMPDIEITGGKIDASKSHSVVVPIAGGAVAAKAASKFVPMPAAPPLIVIASVVKGVIDHFKNKAKKEEEEYRQLLKQAEAENAAAKNWAAEQMRIRQDARTVANTYLDRLAREFRNALYSEIDRQNEKIIQALDAAVLEQSQHNQKIQQLLDTLRGLRSQLSLLRQKGIS